MVVGEKKHSVSYQSHRVLTLEVFQPISHLAMVPFQQHTVIDVHYFHIFNVIAERNPTKYSYILNQW